MTGFRPATTRRERKPLKLNVTSRTIERLVAIKLTEGHKTLSETLEFLVDREAED